MHFPVRPSPAVRRGCAGRPHAGGALPTAAHPFWGAKPHVPLSCGHLLITPPPRQGVAESPLLLPPVNIRLHRSAFARHSPL